MSKQISVSKNEMKHSSRGIFSYTNKKPIKILDLTLPVSFHCPVLWPVNPGLLSPRAVPFCPLPIAAKLFQKSTSSHSHEETRRKA